MTKPTRAWPHLDDAEYDRRVTALTAAINTLEATNTVSSPWFVWTALWSLTLAALKPKKMTADQAWQMLDDVIIGPFIEDLPENFDSSPAELSELIENTAPETRVALALNPFTHQDLLKSFLWDDRFTDDWAYSPLCCLDIGLDSQIRCKDAAALNAFLEPGHFDKIIEADQDELAPQQSCVIARNPALPLSIFEKLANSPNYEIRASVVLNPVLPLAIVEKLAEDANKFVRSVVAENPYTPVALLEKLARDPDAAVRLSVMKNPATPTALTAALLAASVEDENESVREWVAENPSTPVALLEKLAEDDYAWVRAYVADNPSTPPALAVTLLERLAEDENEEVRWRVASNPSTPVALLAKLAEDENEEVRWRVADNPSTPVALLEKLAEDEVDNVRGEVARNPTTPVAALDKLARDEVSSVRAAAYKNPNATDEIRAQAALLGIDEDDD